MPFKQIIWVPYFELIAFIYLYLDTSVYFCVLLHYINIKCMPILIICNLFCILSFNLALLDTLYYLLHTNAGKMGLVVQIVFCLVSSFVFFAMLNTVANHSPFKHTSLWPCWCSFYRFIPRLVNGSGRIFANQRYSSVLNSCAIQGRKLLFC